ncbi:hypothetical protein [Pelagicoccus sp. SDUM812005]|uniref:hypothetical protein n=1 Tax=Pelagicoccus sp. SDUM812005 TaxID=3041257 RepID=UPI00280C871A|nr:hypothetical protein [Pelagicoccus sp. SDUM812005]MDQ8181453.1 hypothetical protein [Pelagicoccus sp. SDUM812005]
MKWVWCSYGISIATVALSAAIGAWFYPGGFDWFYEVMSALASRKHNPEGGAWFAAGIALSMAALFPVAYRLYQDAKGGSRLETLAAWLVGVGVGCGVLVGLERLFVYHLSDLVDKAHEALALVTFLSLFFGNLGLAFTRTRRAGATRWVSAVVVGPLLAIGLSQLALYLDQRDLGWVDAGWREMGIPIWYSFAFWQWLASGALWVSLGLLLAQRPK